MIKTKQLRDKKGHFMTVEQTKKALAAKFLTFARAQWKTQTYQSSLRYGSFEGFVRNRFMSRKGDFAVVNWDAVKGVMKS